MEGGYDDLIKSAMADADRLAIGVLAHCVRELATLIGVLNALTGTATEEFTNEHIAVSEQLREVLASATSIAERFAPRDQPQ